MFCRDKGRSTSYIEMSADKLTALCREMQRWINEKREEEKRRVTDAYIQRCLKWHKRRNRFRSFFFLKPIPWEPMTTEEVLKEMLRTGDFATSLDAIRHEMMYERHEEACRKLLKLAKNGDPVMVSGEDLDLIA